MKIMTKEELIKTLKDEISYCDEQESVNEHKNEVGLCIFWKGKKKGLGLALEYVFELEGDNDD